MGRSKLLLGLALPFLFVRVLNADDFTYRYTGPNYTVINNDTPREPQYAYTDHLTVTITLDAPILSDGLFTNFDSKIVSFTLADGVQVISDANGLGDFRFETKGGAISGWSLDAGTSQMPFVTRGSGSIYSGVFPSFPLNAVNPPYVDDGFIFAPDQSHANTFEVESAEADPSRWVLISPEPPTVMLLTTVGILTAAIQYRRKSQSKCSIATNS